MDPSSDPLSGVISGLFDVAGSYIGQGITVAVKTNYTPSVTVYSGSLDGSGSSGAGSGNGGAGGLISKLIGLQVGVTVTDASGRTLANYGGTPAIDPVRLAIALAVIGALGYFAFKLVRRL